MSGAKTKRCPKCGETKLRTDFHRNAAAKDGVQTYCKVCLAAYLKGRNPFSDADYDAMLAAQGGGCAICGTDKPGGNGRFHLDHDHGCCPQGKWCTKCARGLLCFGCNLILGHAHDTTVTLAAAFLYLVDHQIRSAQQKMKGETQ